MATQINSGSRQFQSALPGKAPFSFFNQILDNSKKVLQVVD